MKYCYVYVMVFVMERKHDLTLTKVQLVLWLPTKNRNACLSSEFQTVQNGKNDRDEPSKDLQTQGC